VKDISEEDRMSYRMGSNCFEYLFSSNFTACAYCLA
jgi:hypothetical protein